MRFFKSFSLPLNLWIRWLKQFEDQILPVKILDKEIKALRNFSQNLTQTFQSVRQILVFSYFKWFWKYRYYSHPW